MQYLGIDWSYRRASSFALSERGEIVGKGWSADQDRLARLVLELGRDVRAVVEMMSGGSGCATGSRGGVEVKVVRRARSASRALACKTDKVDAGCWPSCARDMVPELWVPSLEDRELRERLRGGCTWCGCAPGP